MFFLEWGFKLETLVKYNNSCTRKMRVSFYSDPRLSGWFFQQCIHGGVLPFFPLLAGLPP